MTMAVALTASPFRAQRPCTGVDPIAVCIWPAAGARGLSNFMG